MIEGFAWGGLLQQTTDVENYPGFPEGIQGPEMMQRFRDQAERFGTRFITDDATRIEFAEEDGGHPPRVRRRPGDPHPRRDPRDGRRAASKLDVPGEDELAARGVSYCATCDAAFFRDHNTLVVGGGDTAMEEATFLAKFAGKVTIVHRRDEFRASAIMLDRARDTENIEFLTPYVVERFEPGENGSLAKAVLQERGGRLGARAGGDRRLHRHRPQAQLAAGRGPASHADENGYLEVEGRSTRTRVPGVFAAGDLTDHVYRQAVTAAGTGCVAALDAEAYLRDTPIDAEAHWAPD